jgi:hypothetical protein
VELKSRRRLREDYLLRDPLRQSRSASEGALVLSVLMQRARLQHAETGAALEAVTESVAAVACLV